MKTFYVGSTKTYKKLKDAVEEATQYEYSTIYLDPETFDLVEEFGQDHLDHYDGSMYGLWLKNGVRLIGASGSKIVFDYQGNNPKIHELFSPFNAGPGGFELVNIWVESRNCRYSVHDERYADGDVYHNIYRRCTFLHDSRHSGWGPHQAVGGGLGLHGDILFEDCYCLSEGCVHTITYHNSISQTHQSQSNIIIRNCWLNGTAQCANYGISTEKSRMIVNGCSLLMEPVIERELTPQRADNMELITWGNTIR